MSTLEITDDDVTAALKAMEPTAERLRTERQESDTARPDDPPGEYTDIALANRLIDEHGNRLVYVKAELDWYVYSDTECRWKRDDKLRIFTLVKKLVTAAAHECYNAIFDAKIKEGADEKEARAKALGVANTISTAPKVAAVEKMARERVAVTPDIFDRDIWALNTPGGAVNLRDGTIRPARPSDYFTRVTPVAPQRIPTPRFDQFMREIMGAWIPPVVCACGACRNSTTKPPEERLALHLAEVEELVKYQLRFYGYCLSGDVKEHILALQVGPGGNGKGALNDFVSLDVLGLTPDGYACEIPIKALLVTRNEQHPCELMPLRGARLALSRESDESGRLNEGAVKRLTGGDTISARGMRENWITWRPTHKTVLFTNVAPRLEGAGQPAWKRRLHMQPFPQEFTEEEDPAEHTLKADLDLLDKLKEEAPGVLQLLIDASIERLRLGGTKPPLTVRLASDAYLAQQNLVARFVAECCTRAPELCTTVEELWTAFTLWCEQNDEEKGRRIDFNGKLKKVGVKITRTTGERGVCNGIALAEAQKSENAESAEYY